MVRPLQGACLLMTLAAVARADLAEYLSKPDPSYAFKRLGDGSLPGGARYIELILTSQTWRDIAWKHRLTLVRPAELGKPTHALLLISGGSWKAGDESRRLGEGSRELAVAAQIASTTGAPVAVLNHVPFQPMFDGKHEDEIISYTFLQFMQSGEGDWPLLLPMVKAAVRAMDTVQTVAREDWKVEIPNFVVTGASKRGWTTYLTSAMDKRVAALAPMVFDTLKLDDQMKHQVATWGRYSEQIADYTELDLPGQLDTPPGRKLVSIVDPYAYRAKLTQPKLIMLGTNDRYWPLDALNLYWPGLEGEKYILYVPNSGHGLNDLRRVISDISALVLRASGKLKFPQPQWDIREGDSGLELTIRSDAKPESVSAWTATSATRDFRESKWSSQKLEPAGNAYTFRLPTPEKGFAAAFGELVYKVDGHELFLSTNVRIIGAQK